MKAIQLREDFMSIASHELKTPLTPLKMQIQLLSQLIQTGVVSAGGLGEKLKSVISESDQQIVRLSRLVDDILDATRLRTGQFALKFEKIDLNSLISNVIERLSHSETAGKSRIEFYPEDVRSGYWDRLRIEQVVINLLNNAIKFGLGKPVIVRTKSQEGRVVFSVQDFGIGIAKEHQTRIFERLERAVSLKQFGGLGMGLFIARQIVELHGGGIFLESVPGQGSTFTVELPEGGRDLLVAHTRQ
jgi:signal transduction histidine kinase